MAIPARQRIAQRRAADVYRRNQAAMSTRLVRDLMRLWRSLFDPQQAEESWGALRQVMSPIVRTAAEESARLAADYYLETRRIARVPTPYRPQVVGGPDEEWTHTTLDSTGLGSYLNARKRGLDEAKAKERAGVELGGAAARLAQMSGRETVRAGVERDDHAIGWMRITDADPCAFCSMVASRGPVYKSEETAGGHGDRFAGVNPFAWHNWCGCVAVPVWSEDDPRVEEADRLYDEWLDVTSVDFGVEKFRAWRRHWDAKRSGGSASEPVAP